MTSLEPASHPLETAMADAFADLIDGGAVDIVAGLDPDAWEVQADAWTLSAEGWPLAVAFIAIDDEPSDPQERASALDAAFGPGDLAALRDLDARLDGAVSEALRRSGDELSVMVAEEVTTLA